MARTARLCAVLCCLLLPGFWSPARSEVAKARIALQYGLVYLPIMVAESEGFYDKQAKALGLPGLEVSLHRFSGSTAVNDAILSGSVDVASLGTVGLLIAWEKTRGRQHVKGVAGLAGTLYVLYTNKPEIKGLADFTDQDKIAVPAFNSPQAILLRVAAEKLTGSAAKANVLMVSMPHPEATNALLSGNAISGYFSTPPFSQIVARESRVHPILNSTLVIAQNATAAAVATTQGFMDDNPKVTRAVLAALEEADKLIKSDPKRAAEIYVKSEESKLAPAEVEGMITDGSTTYDVVPHGIADYARFMQQQGMMKTPPAKWQDVFFPIFEGRAGD